MDEKDFDAQAYLSRYPDIAEAVARKVFPSAFFHYHHFGSAEGRVVTAMHMPEVKAIDPSCYFQVIRNPGYAPQAPTILNKFDVPLELIEGYEAGWNKRRKDSEIKLAVIENAIVTGDGVIFNDNGCIFSDATRNHPPYIIDAACRSFRQANLSQISFEPGTTLLIEKAGVSNYGHWLFEMLPLAHLFREYIETDWFLRVPLVEMSGMNAVIRDSLALLGISSQRLRPRSTASLTRYERLIVVEGFSNHGHYYSPLALPCFDYMAAKIDRAGTKRVWVSRETDVRRLIHESEVCKELCKRGWTIALPVKMTFVEQIALFKSASCIAGVNGAGLTNIAFAPFNAKVLSFVPMRMPDFFFCTLAQMRWQNYAEVRCHQENTGGGEWSWQAPINLSVDYILTMIDRFFDGSDLSVSS